MQLAGHVLESCQKEATREAGRQEMHERVADRGEREVQL